MACFQRWGSLFQDPSSLKIMQVSLFHLSSTVSTPVPALGTTLHQSHNLVLLLQNILRSGQGALANPFFLPMMLVRSRNVCSPLGNRHGCSRALLPREPSLPKSWSTLQSFPPMAWFSLVLSTNHLMPLPHAKLCTFCSEWLKLSESPSLCKIVSYLSSYLTHRVTVP